MKYALPLFLLSLLATSCSSWLQKHKQTEPQEIQFETYYSPQYAHPHVGWVAMDEEEKEEKGEDITWIK